MARHVGVEFPGAIRRIGIRGNGRQDIFRDGRDRERFFRRLAESVEKYGIGSFGGLTGSEGDGADGWRPVSPLNALCPGKPPDGETDRGSRGSSGCGSIGYEGSMKALNANL